jgi:adenylate kinase family enzyme
MRIHILGASGSGVTTLGKYLALQMAYPYFDVDDFYWEKTIVPFTVKRSFQDRENKLKEALSVESNWIVGGSMVSWGPYWLTAFDLVVFLWLPAPVRLTRLRNREYERYGEVIIKDPERNQHYEAFMEWASRYDDPDFEGRSLIAHQAWLQKLPCPVLEIKGDFSVAQRAQKVLEKITNVS